MKAALLPGFATLIAAACTRTNDGGTNASGDSAQQLPPHESGESAALDDDSDGYDADVDCDDDDPGVHPAATETCNGIDDDCDGAIDEDASDATVWFVDDDRDGFGAESVLRCAGDDGFVDVDGDCDDTDVSVYPGAEEVCDDGVDNDCIAGGTEGCRPRGVLAEEAAYHVIENSYPDAAGFWPDLSAAGDVNGDGLPDLLVGLPDYRYTLSQQSALGAAFLCYGPLTGTHSLTDCIGVFDDDGGDQLGQSVTGLGDVNGDGYGDFFVGNPALQPAMGAMGRYETEAYMFMGPVTGDVGPGDADVTFTQFDVPTVLGTDAAPGPIRAGERTVIVSAPFVHHEYYEPDGWTYGSIYVLGLSGGEINETYGYGYLGVMTNETWVGSRSVGEAVHDLGDTNGDGIEDFGTSADLDGDPSGFSFIVTDSPTDDVSLTDAAAVLEAAFHFGPAHDENGDGYADILASSWEDNRVRLFLGPVAGWFDVRTIGTEEASFEIPPDEFNRAYDPVGVDLDGDSLSDVAFVTDHELEDRTHAGLFVEYAPASGSIQLDDMSLIVRSSVDTAYVVENVGDVDVDGHEDLVIAAYPGFDTFDLHLLLGSGL